MKPKWSKTEININKNYIDIYIYKTITTKNDKNTQQNFKIKREKYENKNWFKILIKI